MISNHSEVSINTTSIKKTANNQIPEIPCERDEQRVKTKRIFAYHVSDKGISRTNEFVSHHFGFFFFFSFTIHLEY